MKLTCCGPLSRVIRPAFISTLGTSLVVLFAAQTAFGQTTEPRPVARLISASSSILPNTRARRVITPESPAKNLHSVLPVGPSFDKATVIEKSVFEATNDARIKGGFTKLEWDPQLCLLARQHSESMAQRGYFDHETPEGLLPRDRAHALGLRFRVLAENIAYNKGFDNPGAFAVERWMLSPGHRSNILYIGFQASAIGSFIAKDGSVYVTQIFIAR